MTSVKLTTSACRAHKTQMRGLNSKPATGAMLVLSVFALGGCITVNAPAEPIVIELNINITQEVIYRLAESAGNTIEENADIF